MEGKERKKKRKGSSTMMAFDMCHGKAADSVLGLTHTST